MNTPPTARRLPLAGAVAAAIALAGCASENVEQYASERPQLDLARYFNGKIVAYGMFQDRGGKVVRRFTVDIDGHWEGSEGVLDEHFTYSDGKKERRVWHLTKYPDGRYSGTAGDVVGTASGRAAGNALQWSYTLRLPVDDKVYEVQFDDWMYLMSEQVMLNRATMSKFGIRLGEVTLSFQKQNP